MAQRKRVPNFDQSEPEFLISVMDRHTDWCTIVCLIGGGQEINAGEAGLTEWFAALKKRFGHWKIYHSPQLTHRDYHWGQDLSAMLAGLQHKALADLHLAGSVRSFRAEKLSEFVGAVIAGEIDAARSLALIKQTYPIVLTRDLAQAKAWLRLRGRGSERFGLVASSGASRLKLSRLPRYRRPTALAVRRQTPLCRRQRAPACPSTRLLQRSKGSSSSTTVHRVAG
jgi:hypothetical protein